MGISLWYVYDDENETWVTDSEHPRRCRWLEAKEFTSEEEAKKVADQFGFVVFGWVQ